MPLNLAINLAVYPMSERFNSFEIIYIILCAISFKDYQARLPTAQCGRKQKAAQLIKSHGDKQKL